MKIVNGDPVYTQEEAKKVMHYLHVLWNDEDCCGDSEIEAWYDKLEDACLRTNNIGVISVENNMIAIS